MQKVIELFEDPGHYVVRVNNVLDCRYPKTEENLRNAKAYCFDLFGTMKQMGENVILKPYLQKP